MEEKEFNENIIFWLHRVLSKKIQDTKKTFEEYDKNPKLAQFKHWWSCVSHDLILIFCLLSSPIWIIPRAIQQYLSERKYR